MLSMKRVSALGTETEEMIERDFLFLSSLSLLPSRRRIRRKGRRRRGRLRIQPAYSSISRAICEIVLVLVLVLVVIICLFATSSADNRRRSPRRGSLHHRRPRSRRRSRGKRRRGDRRPEPEVTKGTAGHVAAAAETDGAGIGRQGALDLRWGLCRSRSFVRWGRRVRRTERGLTPG